MRPELIEESAVPVLIRLFVVVLLLVGGSVPASTAVDRYQRGPFTADQALPAPEWQISEWIGGRLRFQKFGTFDADWAAGYIRELIAEVL